MRFDNSRKTTRAEPERLLSTFRHATLKLGHPEWNVIIGLATRIEGSNSSS